MKHITFDDMMAESFRKDPAYAVELLNSILEDGESGELLMALRQMDKAFGEAGRVADQAQLEGLYRTLSAQDNPQVGTLAAMLRTLGLRLAVQPMQQAA